MMLGHNGPAPTLSLAQAVLGYGLFALLGLFSRVVPVLFIAFVAYGIAFPMVWAAVTHDWQAVGFTRRGLRPAVAWGLAAGVVWGLYTLAFFGGDRTCPPLWGLQVAIAVPIWLLVMSPFQEFFFRGWLQPRLETVAGRWGGLCLTALAFAVWHFFPHLEGTMTSTLPLSSPIGLASTVLLGLVTGYLRQSTASIVAPWLAHAVAGVALVLVGQMSFVGYS